MKTKREATEQKDHTHGGRARLSHRIRMPLREPKENNLEMAIGHEVRAFRKKLGITVTDLAAATGISLGMLSKIENGNISPSLTTLQSLSRALGVPLTAFFRRYEEPRNAVFVKAGQGIELERRGTRAGHQYNLLGHIDNNTSGVIVEPYLITLTADSDTSSRPSSTRAWSFSTCSRARSFTAMATSFSPCSRATACSSTPMRRTVRRNW